MIRPALTTGNRCRWFRRQVEPCPPGRRPGCSRPDSRITHESSAGVCESSFQKSDRQPRRHPSSFPSAKLIYMPREIYCDAVLLDMDGTLVDSTECVIRHWRIWTERHHLDLDKVLEVSHGRPTIETMKLVAPHLASMEEVRWLEAAESADLDGIKPMQGALPFVAR